MSGKACCRLVKKFTILIMVIILFSGCSNTDKTDEAPKEVKDKIQIGMSFDSFVLERWTREKEVFVSTAANMGAEVNVQSASGDLEVQKEHIRYFIKKGVDTIVIVAVNSEELSDVVNEAKDAGISVIAYDRCINNAKLDLYISFDNEKVGVLMAKQLLKETSQDAKFIMLCGPTTDTNVGKVVNGFDETISNTNVKIIDSMNAEGWKAELAYEFLYDHSEYMDEIDGIMCGNDNISTQAVKYLAERGMAGKIPVVGQDADLEACQRIVEGTQSMTVYKPVEQLASVAAKYAVALAKGNSIEDDCEIIPNGNTTCPYISLEPVAVDADNIDQIIIDGGFHLRDEVYLNIKE